METDFWAKEERRRPEITVLKRRSWDVVRFDDYGLRKFPWC